MCETFAAFHTTAGEIMWSKHLSIFKKWLYLGLSKVFENTAMFGDLVLRLPDIVHSIYDKNKEWQLLIGWCYWFCKESGVFDGTNGKLLHLVRGNLHFIFIPSLYHFYLWKMHLDIDLLYSLNQSLQSLFVFIFARRMLLIVLLWGLWVIHNLLS